MRPPPDRQVGATAFRSNWGAWRMLFSPLALQLQYSRNWGILKRLGRVKKAEIFFFEKKSKNFCLSAAAPNSGRRTH
jgi:hypothetical protein